MSGPTTAELDELGRLARLATPGPWKQDARYVVAEVPKGRPGGEVIVDVTMTVHPHSYDTDQRRRQDAAYIAAVSPDVILRLITALRAAR